MRIIAGKWRGRPLRAPGGCAVRPTSDKVREAIFDLLRDEISGTAALDLFAGSGALGLEALSRGAASAVFVEADPAAFAVLKRNLDTLGAENARTFLMDYRQALRRLRAGSMRFGMAFLDPPYGKGLAAEAAARLSKAQMLENGGIAVVEEAFRAPESAFPAGWTMEADRRYGDTRVRIYRVSA